MDQLGTFGIHYTVRYLSRFSEKEIGDLTLQLLLNDRFDLFLIDHPFESVKIGNSIPKRRAERNRPSRVGLFGGGNSDRLTVIWPQYLSDNHHAFPKDGWLRPFDHS